MNYEQVTLDLSGETVLVTGASGNLGQGIAERLAAAGAAIIVHYHKDETAARALAERLGADRQPRRTNRELYLVG